VWELVGEALGAFGPTFEDVFVRHFDVQFTFDGDGLFEAEECRRVAVTTDVAKRYARGERDVAELRRVVEDENDIDDEIAPVAWGECKDYVQRNDAAVVHAGTTAAMAASASAATCANAASAGAATGGSCGV
jgi:hypothetical protein